MHSLTRTVIATVALVTVEANASGAAFDPGSEFGAAIVTGVVGIPAGLISLPSNIGNVVTISQKHRTGWSVLWGVGGLVSGSASVLVGATDMGSGLPELGVPIFAYGVATVSAGVWALAQPSTNKRVTIAALPLANLHGTNGGMLTAAARW